jgi:flagellar biosynthetic protein FliO
MAFSSLLSLLANAPQDPPTGYGWALLRMMAALVVVCVIAYFALRYGIRRLAVSKRPGNRIKVIERCALESNKALWVVEVDKRCLLLGSSDAGVSLLTEIEGNIATAPTARAHEFLTNAEISKGNAEIPKGNAEISKGNAEISKGNGSFASVLSALESQAEPNEAEKAGASVARERDLEDQA